MLAPKESQSHVSAKRNLEMDLKQVIPGNCTSTALIWQSIIPQNNYINSYVTLRNVIKRH